MAKLHSPLKLERLATQTILKQSVCCHSQLFLPKRLSIVITEEELYYQRLKYQILNQKHQLLAIRFSLNTTLSVCFVIYIRCDICRKGQNKLKEHSKYRKNHSKRWPEYSLTYHKCLKERNN